jgi:DNA-binding transcriptional MocR family regulator
MTDGRHTATLISPLAAAGRADEVVQRVRQAIQLGLFVDGEQLPPETEFAAQLGVSAMTLRKRSRHCASRASWKPGAAGPAARSSGGPRRLRSSCCASGCAA